MSYLVKKQKLEYKWKLAFPLPSDLCTKLIGIFYDSNKTIMLARDCLINRYENFCDIFIKFEDESVQLYAELSVKSRTKNEMDILTHIVFKYYINICYELENNQIPNKNSEYNYENEYEYFHNEFFASHRYNHKKNSEFVCIDCDESMNKIQLTRKKGAYIYPYLDDPNLYDYINQDALFMKLEHLGQKHEQGLYFTYKSQIAMNLDEFYEIELKCLDKLCSHYDLLICLDL